MFFWKTPRCQVAIDVGTAFCRVAAESCGNVTFPTAMFASRPLRGGVVVEGDRLVDLIRPWFRKAKGLGVFGPVVLAGAPTDLQFSERQALTMVLQKAGATRVQIVPEPLAAALGSGLDISSPYAQMIVDIGEGVTDCMILRGGGILTSRAVRVGCSDLRESVRVLGSHGNRAITSAEAERIVAVAGIGRPSAGLSTEAHELMEPAVGKILSLPATLLREVSDDVGCEIIESGILLTGGGAMIPGFSERLALMTLVRVTTPESPLDVVIRGLRGMLSP